MTPAHARWFTGGSSSAPTMVSEPRGSRAMARRQWSCSSRKRARRSARVPMPRSGKPPVMTRVGSPPVWESMKSILCMRTMLTPASRCRLERLVVIGCGIRHNRRGDRHLPGPTTSRERTMSITIPADELLPLFDGLPDVVIFVNRAHGWCLTFKRPLRVRSEIVGVIGISRDLGLPDARHPTYERLRLVLDHMQTHYSEAMRVGALADMASLSVAQLERHFRRVFQLTPQQVLTKLRIDRAMHLLRDDDSVAAVGMACGFVDQSAFSRQFKATVGMTPRDYRSLIRFTT